MSIFEYGIIYIICWWMVLFMVLPFKAGAKENPEADEYHASPAKAHIKGKLIATTFLAIPAAAVVSWVIDSGMLMS